MADIGLQFMEHVERQIDACLEPHAKWGSLLRFPQPLEARFRQDSVATQREISTRMGIVGILLFDIFLIGDYILYPSRIWHCVVIRVFLFTPCAALAIFIGKRYRGTRLHEISRVLALAFAGFCALAAGSSATGRSSVFTELNLILVLSLGNLAMRMRIPQLLTLNLLWLTENAVYLSRFARLDRSFRVGCFFIYIAFGVTTLIAAWQIEREQRRIFLLMQRDELRAAQLAIHNRDLEQLSVLDPLTEVANRRYLEVYLDDLWRALAKRNDAVLSLVMADIDHFKQINDTHGHLFGDRMLKLVTSALSAGVRPTDLVARFGGEEFVIVLPNLSQESAARIAERISLELRSTPIAEPGQSAPIAITISCGVAATRVFHGTTPQQLLEQADRALYEAKNAGRDRVRIFTHATEKQESVASA
jgi:diguanylate cyclase (GGDEF)-like protein